MHPYLPHTDADIKKMLDLLGVDDIEALFCDIEKELFVDILNDLPEAHSEQEIIELVDTRLADNHLKGDTINFAGGGIYEHTIPSIVPYLISRSEFATAYTPYQPEISQGTLQCIFEYQTMITRLTGMYASNASHYDGSTATAEAIMMAHGANKRNKVLVSEGLNPETIEVIKTYCKFKGIEVVNIPLLNGVTDTNTLDANLDNETTAVVIQSPNFLGQIEDMEAISEKTHEVKGLLVVNANLVSLGVLKAPGDFGADIVVGDGQGLGNPMNFGGPTVGFMATTKKLMRKLPGRIVGYTKDLDGKDAFVLTLQAREQHIRREKATSNITSNQALNALATTITIALLGPNGLNQMVRKSMAHTRYFCDQVDKLEEVTVKYTSNFLYETVISFKNADRLYSSLVEQGIVLGVPLEGECSSSENDILVCITEKYAKKHIDNVVSIIEQFYSQGGKSHEA